MKKYTLIITLLLVLLLTACSSANKAEPITLPSADERTVSSYYPVELFEVTELRDKIPMVMINGTLYLDTGYKSTVEARCGVMDGEITSTVDGSQTPTEDNQSNFGSGYGWQYGVDEGTVEIYMNEDWWVFAAE